MNTTSPTPRNVQPRTIDLGDSRFATLPAEQRAFLVGRLGSNTTIEAVDALVTNPALSPIEQSIALAFRRSLTGDLRATDGVALTKDGVVPLTSFESVTLGAARAPTGATEPERAVRESMAPSLLGHETQLESFVEMARRWRSPMRPRASVMLLVGNRGHGKEQALQEYARQCYGAEARVVDVDLRDIAPNAAAALFGKDGPLSAKTLKRYDPTFQEEQEKDANGNPKPAAERFPAVVRLLGVENLKRDKPELARELQRLLLTARGSQDFCNVQFFIDFEQPATNEARKLLLDALDTVAARGVYPTAVFEDLSGKVLGQYAQELLLKGARPEGLGNIIIEFDAAARDLLERALATPHAPLEQLDERLYEFIFAKLDTHTSINREGGIVRVSVAPDLATSASAASALVTSLHDPLADLALGQQLFVVNEVGRRADDLAERGIAISRGHELGKQLSVRVAQLAAALPLDEEGTWRTFGPLLEATSSLAQALERTFGEAKRLHELQRETVLTVAHARDLGAGAVALRAASVALANHPDVAFEPELRVELARAAEGWAGAIDLIVDKCLDAASRNALAAWVASNSGGGTP